MKHNSLKRTITHALEELKAEQGDAFDISKVNLAELERRTGITRAKLRRLKDQGFQFKEHGRKGFKAKRTKLTGFEDTINTFLAKGVSNSNVIFERIKSEGYAGGLTIVKDYISAHKHLIPPKRQMVSGQGNRGRRYRTKPGEAFQMDWGFVHVENGSGGEYRAACFAMVCHHCGKRFVEFFPNAKQENLFIGMLHAFEYMGVPEFILTDNMKSVVIGRDENGHRGLPLDGVCHSVMFPQWRLDCAAYYIFTELVAIGDSTTFDDGVVPQSLIERYVSKVKVYPDKLVFYLDKELLEDKTGKSMVLDKEYVVEYFHSHGIYKNARYCSKIELEVLVG